MQIDDEGIADLLRVNLLLKSHALEEGGLALKVPVTANPQMNWRIRGAAKCFARIVNVNRYTWADGSDSSGL